MNAASQSPRSDSPRHDDFFWLGEINKASTLMLVDHGLLDPAAGAHIARTVQAVIAAAEPAGSPRPGDYLELEKLLLAQGGQDVTKVHIGRSRVDLGRTLRRLHQRRQVLATVDALLVAEAALLGFIGQSRDAVLPGYTLGVQAQPTTLGHYISGYAGVLRRHMERLRRAFDTVNLSPLGAGALATSAVPLDRTQLAHLLGFAGPIENSIDAVHFAPIDTGVELAFCAAGIALSVGQLLSDLEAQYRTPRPWFTIAQGPLTGISSMMPQKRNPNALNALRTLASAILGQANTYLFMAHNVPHGVLDYSGTEPQQSLLMAQTLLSRLAEMFGNLHFDPDSALREVKADFATTTRLAELLQLDSGVPYRVAHHFVSELVDFSRANGLQALEIGYPDASRLYGQVAQEAGIDPVLPLDPQAFRDALDPTVMVRTSRGLGGPQPDEVARLIASLEDGLAQDRAWRQTIQAGIEQAASRLQQAFTALLATP